MKPIDRSEVLGLADYEAIRDRFRSRVIEEKKRRRVQLGPNATALFENRDTVLLQIQEMLRTERITRAGAVQHELDTYNENVPADDELSCTVMIEIPDPAEREAFLKAVVGFEKHVWLAAEGHLLPALSQIREGAASADRTTAVHYLKFKLPPAIREALRAGKAQGAELRVDHPAYEVRASLSPATLGELMEDLRA